MDKKYLFHLSDTTLGQKGGSKASNLGFLIKKKYPVPKGYVVSWEALFDYQTKGEAIIKNLHQELLEKLLPDNAYAVRSSASIEDNMEFSCAGLFESCLSVKGIDDLLESIQLVWKSVESERLRVYCENHSLDDRDIRMGVIIQEMVEAEFSGVAFSKNPLTGLSEVIIEVGRGNGEEQILAEKNPERWVSKWGNWLEKPHEGIMTEDLAESIVQCTLKIAKEYGKPVDLEWASDGKEIFFLQIRPITRLDIPIYSNRITKEMLPGIIKPLVWSVNTKMINRIWTDILTRLTGDRRINPEDLTAYFFSRAYFNMSLFGHVFESLGMPYEGLELLLGLEQDGPKKPHIRPGIGIMKRLPSLLSILFSVMSAERRFRNILPKKKAVYDDLISKTQAAHDPTAFLDIAKRLFQETEQVAYFNIIIPMEMMMYHRLLSGLLKKEGHDIRQVKLSGLDVAAEQYSPHYHMSRLKDKYGLPERVLSADEEISLEEDMQAFLRHFGHFSDSGNDCSRVPWRESPELVRKMIEMAKAQHQPGEEMLEFKELKLPLNKRMLYSFLYRKTSRFSVLREAVSSLYTYGYGQFRTCFVGLGEKLLEKKVLLDKEDVFYLYWQELENLVGSGEYPPMNDLVLRRKRELEVNRSIPAPELIIGNQEPPVQNENILGLRGIPTSLGIYTGPARVLQGMKDFQRLSHGDVLIIPFSDVGWSPLFAKAGAVVSESGGILSHSSIVAREYRIPAVVSVSGACSIPDGTRITVNGYDGSIQLE